MNELSIYELEKKILKAQNSDEIDAITKNMSNQQLRNVIKLLVARLTMISVEKYMKKLKHNGE